MLSTIQKSSPFSVMRFTVCIIGFIALGVALVGCVKTGVDDHEGENKMSSKTIEQVLKEHTDEWMSIPGVVGTAIGEFEGKPCIKIYVVEKTEELEKKFPASLEGYPLLLEETGEFKALDKD